MDDASADWARWEREQASNPPSPPPPRAPTPVQLSGPSSSRHRPDEVAVETAPAGAAVAAQLERSRQLRPGWQWSPEQKRLRQLLRAQRRVGAELTQLEDVGARILHARRLPTSAQPVDHIVVTAGLTFIVVDIVSSHEQSLNWTRDGHLYLSSAGSLQFFEQTLVDATDLITRTTAEYLPEGWVVSMSAAVAVVGSWAHPLRHTSGRLMVGAPTALRQWMGGPSFPARLDLVDIAVMANAVARACPSAA